jgi:hypothetical protein
MIFRLEISVLCLFVGRLAIYRKGALAPPLFDRTFGTPFRAAD